MKMSIKDPNQKFMVWMMPIMMFVFSCSFPSGLVLYWTVSNLFTIGQTYFYTNRSTARPRVRDGDRLPPKSCLPRASRRRPEGHAGTVQGARPGRA